MAAAPLAEDPKPVTTHPVQATPPAPADQPSRAGFFRRLSVGTNVTVQMFLLALIVLAVNGYAFKHFHRFDFSRDSKYALSPRTKQLIGALSKPVKLILFIRDGDPLQQDINSLAEEYHDAKPSLVSVETVDPFRNAARAQDVQNKYKLAQTENAVIIDYDGRNKIVPEDKMAELDTSGMQYGQPPTVTAFTGEQAITAGLLEVTEGKKSNVYYVQGHGEGAVGAGKPLEVLGRLLDSEHVTVQEINLLNVQTVPADTGVLMILGAKLDFTEREIQLLDAYWTKGGRVFILLNPDAPTPHLAAFLGRLGVQVDDDRVLRTINLGSVEGIIREVNTQLVGDTAIAKQLPGVNVPMSGDTQSLTLEGEKVGSAGTRVEPLLQALKGYWGETEYKDIENTGVHLDKGVDKDGNLAIAATVQKGAVADQRVQTNSARLIVVGNARLVESDGITEQSAAFFVGGLNWLLERETLIGVQPKQIKTFRLSLSPDQLREFFLILVLGIPGLCALLGVVVWWRRRS